MAVAYLGLAEVLSETDHLASAVEMAEASLLTRRRMLASEKDSVFDAMSLASTGVVVADLRARQGDVEGALGLLDETGGVLGELAGA